MTGNERATTARRLGERAEPAAADRLQQDVAGGRGLDRAGVDRAAAGVGGELAEQGVLASRRRPRGSSGSSCRGSASSRSIVQRYFSARLSRQQRTKAPSSAGRVWPVRVQKAASRAGMSPGARNDGVVGIDQRGEGRGSLGPGDQLLVGHFSPARAQVRRHSWTSQRPMMFLSSRVVPATPPSLVKLYRSVSALMTGRGTSTPSSDQVPELR